ncbi:hypothetical protein NQ317_010100 [Molorchus minor]|uniref:Uncharacterized protein n=1 Tax=Molorchus minor TaxID=1323400 RepID=A0ABQ9IYU7_9CUCU|nr:hypothetical protein NQ317_010100 [Molorchus minor]
MDVDSNSSKLKSNKENFSNPTGTMLSEDYAEIVEEGDYSVPAGASDEGYCSSKTIFTCEVTTYMYCVHTSSRATSLNELGVQNNILPNQY